MKLKKLLALLTSALIAVSLCACGDSGSEPLTSQDIPENGEAVTLPENEGEPVGDVTAEDEDVGTLTVDGEKVDTDGLVMMTINGLDVPYDEYRYTYLSLDNSYFSFGDPAFWEANPDSFPVLLEYTNHYVLEAYWGTLIARDYDVSLTDEDYAQIDEAVAQQSQGFETQEDYEQALKNAGFTEDLLRRIITEQVTNNRVYADLFADEGAKLAPSDEEIKEDLSNDYRRVYHVLVTFDHFSGQEGYEDATEDELKAAAKEYAEELRQQIVDGADIYELAQSADDPGMIDNEEGYFFTYGTMVKEFEDAAFSLDVGELSDLVETDYGYHIVLRLEQEEYAEENWDTVKQNVINEVFNSFVDDYLENAEIVYSDYVDKLTYDSIK